MEIAATLYSVWEAAVILGGIVALAIVIGLIIIVITAMDHHRLLIPWSQRKRVERAKAAREVAEERVQEEMAELQYLALQPVRNKVKQAIEAEEIVSLPELVAGKVVPDGTGKQMRHKHFDLES